MIAKILVLLFYLLFPILVIYLCNTYSLLRNIGAIVICYIVGLLIGNLNILPENVDKLQSILTNITIPVAIPLLLFSENIKKVIKMAKTTFTSLLLGILSVLIMIIIGHYILKPCVPDLWKISGMLIGVYTGGTPNLAALSEMLNVDHEKYILIHTTDMVVGGFVLLFLLTFAQKLFLLFLKPFKYTAEEEIINHKSETVNEFESYSGIFSRQISIPLLKAFGLSILIFATAGGLSLLFPYNNQTVVAILTITTLGILASLSPAINNIKKTFQLGMYFILVFSLVVASMADVEKMINREESVFIMTMLIYIILAVVGALFLHGILSWIFKIDADSFIITSVALSMSPPFVPVVAAALKNKTIVVPGIILGIIGYAIGNYLGIFVAYALK
jgi:uncharacterized membrane protein